MKYVIDTKNKTLQFLEETSLQEIEEILDLFFEKDGGVYKNLSEWKLIPHTKEIKSVEYQPYKLQEQPINPYIGQPYIEPYRVYCSTDTGNMINIENNIN